MDNEINKNSEKIKSIDIVELTSSILQDELNKAVEKDVKNPKISADKNSRRSHR